MVPAFAAAALGGVVDVRGAGVVVTGAAIASGVAAEEV
jgi:hypothetical protein